MAALAGAVTLGSCVKDDVSSSVEAVRNAKAQELLAKAAKDNAEAATTDAIRAAKVAHEAADAKAQELLNENQAMANQLRAANLETEIAANLATYEATIAQQKALVQQRMNALEAAVRAAATDKAKDIKTAIGVFNTAYSGYITAQKNVLAAQIRLETAKNDAANASAIAETTMKSLDSQIAAQKDLVAKLEEVSSTGMTAAEAKAAVAVLNAQINKARTEFNSSDEVKALIEAGQNLAAATLSLAATETSTFGAANDLIIQKFWYDANSDGVIDENDAPQLTFQSWWPKTGGVWDNYFYSSGTDNLNAGDINFYDMTKYQMEFTADNLGLDVKDDLAPVGSPYDPVNPTTVNPHDPLNSTLVVGDGVNDDVIGATARGQQILNGLASLQVKKYVVNQQIKSAADEYFKNYSANLKTQLATLKNELKNLESKLGTSSDAKDKKWTKVDGTDGGLTDYAALADAKDKLEKAIAAEDVANKNMTNLPKAVKEAYLALWNVYDKTSSTQEQKMKATLALAQAVETAYGTAAYNHLPANYAYDGSAQSLSDWDEIVRYLFGNSALSYTALDSQSEVEALLESGSPLFTDDGVNTLPATYDKDKLDEIFGKVVSVVTTTRKDGVAKDLKAIHDKAAAELGSKGDAYNKPQALPGDPAKRTAYAAVKYYTYEIEGYFNADHKLTANGSVQKIAAKKDDIAKKEVEIAKSEETVEAYNSAVAGADVAAYDAAAADLAKAVKAYNDAAAEVQDLIDAINDMANEQDALKAAIANDLETQIKNAKDDLADLEKQKANWNNTITTDGLGNATGFADPEAIIAAAEADLKDAQVKLVAAAADLAAAQSALEALVGEIDFDGDDEPADEPAPAPAPAEDETPAEGGESEGGEEA